MKCSRARTGEEPQQPAAIVRRVIIDLIDGAAAGIVSDVWLRAALWRARQRRFRGGA